MEIILAAVDDSLADAWEHTFDEFEQVQVHRGSILDLKVDAVISPANSFGFMDGGIDMAYTMHFGVQLQGRLQDAIDRKHHGELLVGAAEILETFNEAVPFLIAAPTMRVPIEVRTSVNAYLATRAALLLVRSYQFPSHCDVEGPIRNLVRKLAFPGMATGVGRMEPEVCAKQMGQAVRDVLGASSFPATCAEAGERHEILQRSQVG